jgi:hypothetical protein
MRRRRHTIETETLGKLGASDVPGYGYSRFPGTKMNIMTSGTATASVAAKTMMVRLLSNFRTKGSRIRDHVMNVYSLKPRRAIAGSSSY